MEVPVSVRAHVCISSFELRILISECRRRRRFRFQVLGYDIGASDVAFVHLEDLLAQFRCPPCVTGSKSKFLAPANSNSFSERRGLSKLGELVALDVCMEIMDLLYEAEDASLLFQAPCALAASTLVCSAVKKLSQFAALLILTRLFLLIRLLRTSSRSLSSDGSFRFFLGVIF